MTQPDIDWTFDDAPVEGEAGPAGGAGPTPRRPGLIPPVRRARKPWPRWAWLALGALVVAALAGGYLFTRLGWRQLEAQIAAEVAYDDARSRAREIDAVLAAQMPNDQYWRAQRAAEVALGLPAPLPAGNMLPTAYPAQVIKVEALGSNLFAATVRRRYADSAGQVVSFDLVQRYHNAAPGEWQRLSTDYTGLVAATIVQGVWVSATVPTSDLPWLRPALVEADAMLTAACAAWQTCPLGNLLPLAFNVGPEALSPSVPPRSAEAAPAAYPIIFDLPSGAPNFPPRFILSAPQVAGRPADAAAQAAYNRALSAKVLGFMAGAIAQSPRGNSDYFLDALVARMEGQLGLSAAAGPLASALNFVAPADLWRLNHQYATPRSAAALDQHRQALDLMNTVLADQPPAVDGALLETVHRLDLSSLEAWLGTALLPGEVAEAMAHWDTAMQQGLGRPAPDGDWPEAEGLALICADSLSIVTQGARRPVALGFAPAAFYGATLNRSIGAGRYLAVNYSLRQLTEQAFTHLELWVFDQASGAPAVRVSENGYAVGWGADDALYYLPLDEPENDTGRPNGLALRRYDPASGQTTLVATNIFPGPAAAWSADRRSLLLTHETLGAEAGEPVSAVRLLTLDQPAATRSLVAVYPQFQRAYQPLFAPGGTAERGPVAYLLDRFGGVERNLELHVLDLASGEDRVLFGGAEADGAVGSIGMQLLWSPGGAWLGFGSYGGGVPRLFTVEAATGQAREWPVATGWQGAYFPVGFSADDGYFVAQNYNGPNDTEHYVIFDLNAAGDAPLRELDGSSLAWSPNGHTLAFSNPLGVFLVDAATGDYQRLQAEPCDLDW